MNYRQHFLLSQRQSSECISPSFYLIKDAVPIFKHQKCLYSVPLDPRTLPLSCDVIYYFLFSLVSNAAFSLVIITCSRPKTDLTIFSALVDPVPVPQIIWPHLKLTNECVEGRQINHQVSLSTLRTVRLFLGNQTRSERERVSAVLTGLPALMPNIQGKVKRFFLSNLLVK